MSGSVALDHMAEVVCRYRWARREAGRLKATADQAEADLMAEMGTADVGTVNGIPMVARTEKDRPRFDAARFRTDHPELFAQYQYRPPRRRLSILRRGTQPTTGGHHG